MQQKQFDQAEAAFKEGREAGSETSRGTIQSRRKFPLRRRNMQRREDRFETLYERTPGGDKNQAAQLIKFKIYMTLLLEGKESRAHAMMDEFQFTGRHPAFYYAQAAWEFQHNNPEKAADWTASANKIYFASAKQRFADAFMTLAGCKGLPARRSCLTRTAVRHSPGWGSPAVEAEVLFRTRSLLQIAKVTPRKVKGWL